MKERLVTQDMPRFACFSLICALALGLHGPAWAQRSPLAQPGGTQVPPAPWGQTPLGQTPLGQTPSGDATQPTISQPVQVQAGTGVLLRLPQPAATMMSAQPDIARVQPASPTSLFLMGVAPGRTTVIATNASGAAVVIYDVTVSPGSGTPAAPVAPAPGTGEPSTAAVARAIQSAIAQGVQGSSDIRVRAAGNNVILSGSMPNAAVMQQAMAIARGYVGEKSNILNEALVLDSIQVNVRVRIAEINRQVTRQLGFNWQALGASSAWRFGLLTGAAVSGPISPLVGLGLVPLSGATGPLNQLGAGFKSGNFDVNAVIDALAADQLISILAEPNLTAQSGETASFLAGGEFPIPVGSNASNGAATITVAFKQFGISLAVVPTVLSPQRLNLRIRPEVSQLSTNGAVSVPVAGGVLTIPALTVRRAETTIELGSGQSFAIAGLLEKTSLSGNSGLPFLGEVPVLGALFRSNNFQRGETELVIIVTPYLVKPTSNPTALRSPTDGFRPATDLDRILLGRQMAPPLSGEQPIDAGFILK